MPTYEPTGAEIIEEESSPVPCGTCVTTRYLHPVTREVLRQDIKIVVDAEKAGLKIGAAQGEV